jgi:hypothetical protein
MTTQRKKDDDIVALVLSSRDDWETCCVTEYQRDGTWVCGLNFITTVADALNSAEKRGLSIIFESALRKLK